jgi:hypothetical protein
MPIKIFKNHSLESILSQLEDDRIQVLIIPGFKKYMISMDGDDYFVSEGFNSDFDLEMTKKDILDKWQNLKEFHALVVSTGIQLGFLMEKYEKENC